jgi:hypothetical protein
MVTREMINAEIDKVPNERLEELYRVVMPYVRDENADSEDGALLSAIDEGKRSETVSREEVFRVLEGD